MVNKRDDYISSKYKYVYGRVLSGTRISWFIRLDGYNKSFKKERDAALNVDKILISLGKQPLNILKKI